MEVESTLSSYRIFNAVAETGNLSRAAKELYISQPAISKAVSKLEQSLSVKLFTRNSRGVKLTEEGHLLYEYTSSAFSTLRQGEESLKRLRVTGTDCIRLGANAMLCKHLLLPCLQDFMKRYPSVRVTVECHSDDELTKQLSDGKLDLAMMDCSVPPETLEFQSVTRLHTVLAASPSYLETLTNRELSTDTALEADNMDLLLEFIKIGLGMGYIVREFATTELKNGTLTELTSLCPPRSRTVGFAHKRNIPLNESAKQFLAFTKEKYAYDETT